MLYLFFQWSQQPNVPTFEHEKRGVRLTCNGMSWLGVCHDKVILGTSDPWKAFLPSTTVPPLIYFLKPSRERSRMDAFFEGG